MGKVKVTINNKEYFYEKGTTLLTISNDFKDEYNDSILIAFVNNEIYELHKAIKKDCIIEFITLKDRIGNRIYQKGLLFLLNCAFANLYGYSKKIRTCHSIDKAIKMETDINLTENKLLELKNEMKKIVNAKLPIEKCLVKRREAQSYFNKIGNHHKADTFSYITNHYVNLYRIGNIYNYLYSNMPNNTDVFTSFDLEYLDNENFLLKFPRPDDNKIPEYIDRPAIEQAFKSYHELINSLKIETSSDLNKIVAQGNINSLIKISEVVASNNLLEIAKDIESRKDKIKLVLLAGPSSSGKTTTSRKLSLYLKSFGLNPRAISIDDYFKERNETPKLPNGDYDFESIKALDIDLFNSQLKQLLDGKEVLLPTFNFKRGEKEYLGNRLKLEKNDILVIEGLHGINEELTKEIPKDEKYKIYVSPLIDLNIDDMNTISTSDVRLLRRIIRDNRTRGYSAEDTIKSWKNVRTGEEKNIFPYQGDVDIVYNTGLIYELGVLKLYAEPLLYDISTESPYYETVRRLIRFLDMFLAIPTDSIPSESILREFIGKSFFE